MVTTESRSQEQQIELFSHHLKLKGLQPKTVEAYKHGLLQMFKHFGGEIGDLSEDQLAAYYSGMLDNRSWSTVKHSVFAYKFFCEHVLHKPWQFPRLIRPEKTQRLPDIITVEEAERLFNATEVLIYRVFFFTLYSLGLRLSEGLSLTVADIDAQRHRVHIRNSKGNKDRLVPLPDYTLAVLRAFWKTHRNKMLLFPSRSDGLAGSATTTSPLSRDGIHKALRQVVVDIGIKKHITPHSLRHSYATHLLDEGVTLMRLKEFLGHTSVLTTARYVHLTTDTEDYGVEKISAFFGKMKLTWGDLKVGK